MNLTLAKNKRQSLDSDMVWLNNVLSINSKTPIIVAVVLMTKLQTYPEVEYMPFSPAMVRETGAARNSVYRALRDLEEAGFVTVRRRRGESPRVAIIRDHRSE